MGVKHPIKGESAIAFVCPPASAVAVAARDPGGLIAELLAQVRGAIGAFAAPDVVYLVLPPASLPKTRSGKVLRRVLRRIGEGVGGEPVDFGDLSALSEHEGLDALVKSVRVAQGAAARPRPRL